MLLLALACRPDPTTGTGDPGTPPPAVFDVVGFNVESGGSDPQVVADEIVSAIHGESLFGFCEVENGLAADTLMAAVPDPGTTQDWRYVLGTTGSSDRLVLAWDDAVFSLDSSEELDDINVGGTARAPLVGHLTHRATGLSFELVVNHLWRTDDQKRHEQAALLHDWGADQTEPVLMIGDFNFDWDVDTGAHDAGYDALTAGDVFTWVEPDPLIETECSFYDSVLDFDFLGGAAQSWAATAEILRPSTTYCAPQYGDTFSDHRPVRASFTAPVASSGAP